MMPLNCKLDQAHLRLAPATNQLHGRRSAIAHRDCRKATTMAQRPSVQLRAKARQPRVQPLTMTTASVSATSAARGYSNANERRRIYNPVQQSNILRLATVIWRPTSKDKIVGLLGQAPGAALEVQLNNMTEDRIGATTANFMYRMVQEAVESYDLRVNLRAKISYVPQPLAAETLPTLEETPFLTCAAAPSLLLTTPQTPSSSNIPAFETEGCPHQVLSRPIRHLTSQHTTGRVHVLRKDPWREASRLFLHRHLPAID
jgi:hypothetical protein